MKIESIALWRVQVPLYTPYNTTLAALAELDSIVACLLYTSDAADE